MLARTMLKAGAVGLSLIAAAPAFAQDLVDATDPEKLADLFRGFGSARLDVAADGTPAIRGRIDGSAFSVYFYGCDDADKNCSTLNITASWDTGDTKSLEQINEWNASKRFGRAYIDSERNAVVETDINLSGSVTVANMEGNIDWWRIIMNDFKSNVVDAEATAAPSSEQTAAGDAGEGTSSAGTTRPPFAIPRKPN